MKAMKKDLAGVSPVIAVILMVAITVVLAGVVFLWAQSFTDDTGGGVDNLNVRAEMTFDDADDSGTATVGDTNELVFEIISDTVDWGDFEIRIDDGTTQETLSSTNTDNAGDTEAFTPVTMTGALSAIAGTNVHIKIINIGENKIVWEDDIRVTNA